MGRKLWQALAAAILVLALGAWAQAQTTTTSTTSTTTLPPGVFVPTAMAGPWVSVPVKGIINGTYPDGGLLTPTAASLGLSDLQYEGCTPFPIDSPTPNVSFPIQIVVIPGEDSQLRFHLLWPRSANCTGATTPEACCTGVSLGTCTGVTEVPAGWDATKVNVNCLFAGRLR